MLKHSLKFKSLLKKWRIGNLIARYSFLLWIGETIVFWIIEGWHWKATNPVETMLDKITTIGLVLGITILAFVADGLKALIEKEVWETSTQ
jgi:hypothetical protein